MDVDALLARFEGVRRTGAGRWLARCPAHEDRTPSLAIRATDDGRILLRDFGGCETSAVIAAIGVTFSDLFPEQRRRDHRRRGERRPWAPADVLRVVRDESRVVLIAAGDLARGGALDDAAIARLQRAATRIEAAVEGWL